MSFCSSTESVPESSWSPTFTMPGIQQVNRFDAINNIKGGVLNFFQRRQNFFSSVSDGLFLRMHYKYTFWLFMATFAMVWYNWLTQDIIFCVSHYNTETAPRKDHVNLCLSYPFIDEGKGRVTLLYYRWLHWVVFLCALAYILPHKLAKVTRYDKVTKLIDFMSNNITNYGSAENNMMEAVRKHFASEVGGQNSIFTRYIKANFLALGVNAFIFWALDAVLLGKFHDLGIVAFPLTVSRDGQYLTDPLTQAFPPFVDCEIKDVHVLTNKRDETFGCHLLAQEFYEKLFLIIWYWMVFLMIAQFLYIIFLVCFCFKPFRRFIFNRILGVSCKDLSEATQKFQIGDWFVLYKLRVCFYYDGFNLLVNKLADRNMMNKIADIAKKNISNIGVSRDPRPSPNQMHKGYVIE